MQSINILYVITKLELGGAQKQLLSLISHLDRDRYTPYLFTAQEGFLLSEATRIQGLTLKKSRSLERAINPLKDLCALVEIYRLIKKNKIQLVHTHSSKAGILGRLAAKLAAVPFIIHTVHGWSFHDFQPPLLRKLFISLERLTAAFSHKLIVVSLCDKEKGLKNRIGCLEQYAVIHYGIDYSEFNYKQKGSKEKLGIESKDLVVTNISCFKPQKSPLDFIRLASLIRQKFPKIRFLLVGDGVLRKKIEKLIRKLNLEENVILTGWRRDIADILSCSDALVLTSLWEGTPIVALEAAACGLPVVATNTGGIREVVISGETGFLVEPGDTDKLCEKLTTLLNDQQLRNRMSQKAREYLDDGFCLRGMIDKSQGLYEKLISDKGAKYGH